MSTSSIELSARAAPQEAEEETNSDNPFNVPKLALAQELLLVTTVCAAQAIVQACLAQSILPDIVIGRSFAVDQVDGTWGPAAYGLTSGQC